MKYSSMYQGFLNILGVLKNLESLQFTKDELDSAIARCRVNLDFADTFETIMRNLFDFSIFGYYSAGGSGGGSDYVWKYKGNRAKFDNNATQFKVHPGFKDVFGLKKFSR